MLLNFNKLLLLLLLLPLPPLLPLLLLLLGYGRLFLLINAHTLRTDRLALHGIEGLAAHSLLAILNIA